MADVGTIGRLAARMGRQPGTFWVKANSVEYDATVDVNGVWPDRVAREVAQAVVDAINGGRG